jgi:hypothetical protein
MAVYKRCLQFNRLYRFIKPVKFLYNEIYILNKFVIMHVHVCEIRLFIRHNYPMKGDVFYIHDCYLFIKRSFIYTLYFQTTVYIRSNNMSKFFITINIVASRANALYITVVDCEATLLEIYMYLICLSIHCIYKSLIDV